MRDFGSEFSKEAAARRRKREEEKKKKAVRIIISGKVQGVGFRAWLRAEALKRDLTGWVRNRRDGTVEALLAGTQKQVDAMLALCHVGPAASHVARVRNFPYIDTPPLEGFMTLSTM